MNMNMGGFGSFRQKQYIPLESQQHHHKSQMFVNEQHDHQEKNAQHNEHDSHHYDHNTNTHTTSSRHQCHEAKNESPLLWERKFASGNSLDDLDNNIVPIHVEKQKNCTCNLHQYSTRKLETSTSHALSPTSSNLKQRSSQCQCGKCKVGVSPKANRYSAFVESHKATNEPV